MSNILVIQNSRIEDAGDLGKLLQNDGFKLNTVYAKKEVLPKNDYSLVLILGAPQSANDDFPYLVEEQRLIQNFVQKNIPVLGICLGSQLIAKSFGANVFRGSKKEIGFYSDVVHENNSKLFVGIENPFTVFHWHSDTFSLPKNATRLAHSTHYKNQAFQYGSAVALQFHLEVNEEMIKLWLKKTREKFSELSYIDYDKIQQDIFEKLSIVKNNLNIFYRNFKSQFNL